MKNLKKFEAYFNEIKEDLNEEDLNEEDLNEGAQTFKKDKYTVTVDGKAPAAFMKNLAPKFIRALETDDNFNWGFLLKDTTEIKITVELIK